MSDTQKDDRSFDHPPSREELLAEYRKHEEADPASLHYKRHLSRPRLHPLRVLALCALVLSLTFLFGVAVFFATERVWLAVLLGLLALISVCLLLARRILIFAVRVYQRFAPKATRERCRYEPSCSEYMILSVQKYGLVRGAHRGLRRWRSCKPPNGGFDLP